MYFKISYNNEIDEFTKDLTLQMRLENYIKNHFYIAYIISNICPIYLIGGSIRDLMYAKKPKDLDFVVLNKENIDWVLQVFNKFNIKYTYNKFGGFKIKYNDLEVDLWLTNDLYSAIEYNVDGLLFDLKTNQLISLTFDDFINNGLKLINSNNNIENGREKKLIKFEKKYLRNNLN